MANDIKIGVIGGDMRQAVTAAELADVGFETAVFGFGAYSFDGCGITRCADLHGAVNGCAAVVLPLPYSRDGKTIFAPLSGSTERPISTEELLDALSPGQILIGGNFDSAILAQSERRGIKLCDYYKREEISVLNAVPTAEGALEIALRELPVTIYGASVHILGFGRIGKVLARSSSALGASVTVYSRSASDLTWTRVYGYKSYDITKLGGDAQPFAGATVIFNTVPRPVLTADILSRTPKDVLIIDLASAPGGIDREAAEKLGIKSIWALSLPGKTAPVSAGKIISEGIFGILQAEGITPEK